MTKTTKYIIAGIIGILVIAGIAGFIISDSDDNSEENNTAESSIMDPQEKSRNEKEINNPNADKAVTEQNNITKSTDKENTNNETIFQLRPASIEGLTVSTYDDFIELLGDTQINTNLVYYRANINDEEFVNLAIHNYTLDQRSSNSNVEFEKLHNNFESGNFDLTSINTPFIFNNIISHSDNQFYTKGSVSLPTFEKSYIIQNENNEYDYSILTRRASDYLLFQPSLNSSIELEDFLTLIQETYVF